MQALVIRQCVPNKGLLIHRANALFLLIYSTQRPLKTFFLKMIFIQQCVVDAYCYAISIMHKIIHEFPHKLCWYHV